MTKIIYIFLAAFILFFENLTSTNPEHAQQKILIFSYGSLVKQKENKKTGALLEATSFIKTQLMVPISFTFIAGMPAHLVYLSKTSWTSFPLRRTTATIDRLSNHTKPLWFAVSKKTTLAEALENLASREGAPCIEQSKKHDATYLFYVKRVGRGYKRLYNEKWVPGFKNWVTKKSLHRRQQLSIAQLKQLIMFTQEQNAHAAIWAALPSHITQKKLSEIILHEPDEIFIKNTAAYVGRMPPGNKLSYFEQLILKMCN